MKNRGLLSKIRPSTHTDFEGIGGTITATEYGYLYDIGTAFFSPHSPANILSYSQVRDEGHTITLVPHPNGDTFLVITATAEYQFIKQANGLFVHTFDAIPVSRPTFITTVADNEALHSKRDVTKAREAREFTQRLANPPDQRLTTALSHSIPHPPCRHRTRRRYLRSQPSCLTRPHYCCGCSTIPYPPHPEGTRRSATLY